MSLAIQTQEKTVSEVRNIAVSFTGKLDTGELLTGTPTVAEVTTTDLTFANQSVNTAALTINGVSTIIGHAVQFSVSGGSVGTYSINIAVSTDATPSQTLYGTIKLKIIADTA